MISLLSTVTHLGLEVNILRRMLLPLSDGQMMTAIAFQNIHHGPLSFLRYVDPLPFVNRCTSEHAAGTRTRLQTRLGHARATLLRRERSAHWASLEGRNNTSMEIAYVAGFTPLEIIHSTTHTRPNAHVSHCFLVIANVGLSSIYGVFVVMAKWRSLPVTLPIMCV